MHDTSYSSTAKGNKIPALYPLLEAMQRLLMQQVTLAISAWFILAGASH
jgi:hypothetical protein